MLRVTVKERAAGDWVLKDPLPGTAFRQSILDQEQLQLMPSLNANENYLQLHVILCHLYTQLVFLFLFLSTSELILRNGITGSKEDFMAISQMRILESMVMWF